jgi:glycosyltransferase involved in cell wall biosynthesis
MVQHDRMFIVMPAFNEAPAIEETIREIASCGYTRLIVVDDGSDDDTFERARTTEGVIAVRHVLNRGKGAAVKTGIEAAKMLGADAVVTIDADGQHNPAGIAGMLDLIEQGYDVVLGSRLKNPKGMPLHKIAANLAGNCVTFILYGLWVTDSQSGLRAYSRRAMDLIDTRTDRYEYDSEVIREIRRNRLKFVEVPIEVRYTAYSASKRDKMNLKNGLKALIKLMTS